MNRMFLLVLNPPLHSLVFPQGATNITKGLSEHSCALEIEAAIVITTTPTATAWSSTQLRHQHHHHHISSVIVTTTTATATLINPAHTEKNNE